VILYLVRHGETESNRLGLALGRADVPLNQRGIAQTKRTADALVGEPIAAVYSSPLQRARSMAEAIAGTRSLDVQVLPGLIEMDIGELDGLTFREIREQHPKLMEQWASPEGQATAIFGTESLAEVRDRAWRALESLAARHADESVCAVTHNFVILSLLTRALDLKISDFRRLRHAVAAVSVLELRAGGARVRRLNDVCHLE
jgi:broad specificity phosphatase PhoE